MLKFVVAATSEMEKKTKTNIEAWYWLVEKHDHLAATEKGLNEES